MIPIPDTASMENSTLSLEVPTFVWTELRSFLSTYSSGGLIVTEDMVGCVALPNERKQRAF